RAAATRPRPGDGEAADAGSRSDAILAEGAARASARHGGLEVQTRMVRARTVAEGLLDAATGARVLVIVHRGLGRGPFGSTAHAGVLHATGNVAAVRRRGGVEGRDSVPGSTSVNGRGRGG